MSASTKATLPQNFALERSIFNENLYSQLRDFWFADLPSGAKVPDLKVSHKWFGIQQTEEQKAAFDQECGSRFEPALKSVGPEKLALPDFHGYEEEIENAASIASPFLKEVSEANAQDAKKGADTLLSLLLLLDQMPRNIYRSPDGLKLVYSHYDRLAFSLLHSSLKLQPNPVQHQSNRLRLVFQSWFLLPLMHSEHVESHNLHAETMSAWQREAEEANEVEVVEAIKDNVKFGERHSRLIKNFGRYPHRNEALDRENSEEEVEFLKTGDTFGVKQTASTAKDEL